MCLDIIIALCFYVCFDIFHLDSIMNYNLIDKKNDLLGGQEQEASASHSLDFFYGSYIHLSTTSL